MSRIKLNDTINMAIAKMSDGNPGAITAMIEIFNNSNRIDPDDAMGGIGKLLMLDKLGIYGTSIYVLYNDICDRDIAKTIAIIRSAQLGLFPTTILKEACFRQDYSGRKMIPVEELCQKIKEKLPQFNIIIP